MLEFTKDYLHGRLFTKYNSSLDSGLQGQHPVAAIDPSAAGSADDAGVSKYAAKLSKALALSWLVGAAIFFWPITLGLWLYYELVAVRPPQLYYQNNVRNISLLKRCPRVLSSYRPTWYTALIPWMSGHLQTLVHEFLRPVPPMSFNRELLSLNDGGEIAIDYYPYPELEDDDTVPIMLIIHGVTGGSHTQYVRHYVRLLERNGIRPIVMNARGCSASALKTPLYFSCHYTGDIRRVVRHVKEKFPNAPLFATAYSLGANLLAKYMGEEGTDCPLVAAVTLANPFDWIVIQKWLNRTFNKHIYNFILTKSLLAFLGRHRHVFRDHETVAIDDVLQVRTLQEYDEKITTKLWGFDTVHAYYNEASCRHYLSKVAVPLMNIQSLDDPIIYKDVIPYQAFLENPNLILVATDMGGHISWLEGWKPNAFTWADHVCMEFVHSVLDHCMAAESLTNI